MVFTFEYREALAANSEVMTLFLSTKLDLKLASATLINLVGGTVAGYL